MPTAHPKQSKAAAFQTVHTTMDAPIAYLNSCTLGNDGSYS